MYVNIHKLSFYLDASMPTLSVKLGNCVCQLHNLYRRFPHFNDLD